jgi:hypothetical protein
MDGATSSFARFPLRPSLFPSFRPQVRPSLFPPEGVENETRRLLATLPQADLEAVVRFFEAMQAVRTSEEPAQP